MKEILITSSVMILAVMILRFLFRTKVNRRLVYGVWLLVALRLLVFQNSILKSTFANLPLPRKIFNFLRRWITDLICWRHCFWDTTETGPCTLFN